MAYPRVILCSCFRLATTSMRLIRYFVHDILSESERRKLMNKCHPLSEQLVLAINPFAV